MGFSRQENGLPFPSPGIFPTPGDLPNPRGQIYISCIGRCILYYWATSEAQREGNREHKMRRGKARKRSSQSTNSSPHHPSGAWSLAPGTHRYLHSSNFTTALLPDSASEPHSLRLWFYMALKEGPLDRMHSGIVLWISKAKIRGRSGAEKRQRREEVWSANISTEGDILRLY